MITRLLPWALCVASLLVNVVLLSRPREAAPAPIAVVAAPSPAPVEMSTPLPQRTVPASAPAEQASAPAFPTNPSTPAERSLALRAYVNMLAQHIETAEQRAEMSRVLARWVAADPEAASSWVADRGDDPEFDAGARIVSQTFVAQGDFDAATQWADSIRDPSERARAFESIYAESYRHGRVDARAVRASGLPPAAIDGILSGASLD